MNKVLSWTPLATLALGVAAWVTWPTPTDPIWEQVTRPAPKVIESSPKVVVEDSLLRFSKLALGYNQYPLQKVKEGDAQLQAAMTEFAAKYAELRQQLQRPDFWPARRELNALCSYAEILEAQNEPLKAQAVALDALRVAVRFRSNPRSAIGLAERTRAVALSLVELLLARTRWNAQNLAELSHLLKENELPADLQIQELKEQMRWAERGWVMFDVRPEYFSLAFGEAHHKRIYERQSLQILSKLEAGERLRFSDYESANYHAHSIWAEQPDPCLGNPAWTQRSLAFTRLRQQLDLGWVEALRTGQPLKDLGAPMEDWLRPEVQNTNSSCWVVHGERVQLAPWCYEP